MKTQWVGWALVALAVSSASAEELKVRVTGDRVSLRAAPDINSVLLDRVMSGDLLTLKDNSQVEWVGVMPPSSVDVWVHNEFIENGMVLPSRLNIRSGPSLNHSVVGVAERNEKLTVRGETGGWLRIAPTARTVAWINRKYTDVLAAVEPPVDVVRAETTAELNRVMEAVALVPDPKKEQGSEMSFNGILRPAEGGLYKLVKPDVDETVVCYVRGNAEQMNELRGCLLSITGRAYWAIDLDKPFLRPVKIQLLSN